MGLPSSPRGGDDIDWAALHSAEGARTVESLFGFFDRGQHASSHAGADGYRLSGSWVPDERAAWTLLNGNSRSLNLELCGFARWTREQWLSTGWVDGVWNPRQMIRHAAAWLREKCNRHNIPKRLLTPDQVARGERGILDHFRYTIGTGDGNHTDVGKNFPFDVLLADLNASGGGVDPQEDNDVTMYIKKIGGGPLVKAVTSNADGFWGRDVSDAEWNMIAAVAKEEGRTVKAVLVNAWDFDNVPRRSGTSTAVWNYAIPTEPGDKPSKYLPAHQLTATINQNTTPAPEES
jgi:N-acetylmuramoyl-L-alanine amidase